MIEGNCCSTRFTVPFIRFVLLYEIGGDLIWKRHLNGNILRMNKQEVNNIWLLENDYIILVKKCWNKKLSLKATKWMNKSVANKK